MKGGVADALHSLSCRPTAAGCSRASNKAWKGIPFPYTIGLRDEGAEAMKKWVEEVETTECRRASDPAQTLVYEDRLRLAKHIVQAMQAAGVDCELAEAVSRH